jgi:hypothetical protein
MGMQRNVFQPIHSVPLKCRRQTSLRMVHDPSYIADSVLYLAQSTDSMFHLHQSGDSMFHLAHQSADSIFNFAQSMTEGILEIEEKMEEKVEHMIETMDAIPGNDLTEILEEGENTGQQVRGSTIVAFMFKNPLLKALLGTQAGWGLVLVFSLIVIGQAFETLKETISKSLPAR